MNYYTPKQHLEAENSTLCYSLSVTNLFRKHHLIYSDLIGIIPFSNLTTHSCISELISRTFPNGETFFYKQVEKHFRTSEKENADYNLEGKECLTSATIDQQSFLNHSSCVATSRWWQCTRN